MKTITITQHGMDYTVKCDKGNGVGMATAEILMVLEQVKLHLLSRPRGGSFVFDNGFAEPHMPHGTVIERPDGAHYYFDDLPHDEDDHELILGVK